MIDLSISLISTNELHHLKKLLPTLLPAADQIQSEILLIDNHSTDGTHEFIVNTNKKIDIETAKSINPCYSKNHNQNLQRARGRFFVIMNADIVINSEDIFVCLSKYMTQNPDIGIVSPKILNEDGTIQGLNKRYPTVLDFILRFLPLRSLDFILKARLDYYEMRDIGYDDFYDVPFLSGSFMFCRTDLLKSIGGFDTKFNWCFDDVDLCRRVQKTHRTAYFPDAEITHFWQRSGHKHIKKTVAFALNAIRYFNTWGWKLY